MKTTKNTNATQKLFYQSPALSVVSMAAAPVLNSVSGNGITYSGFDDDGEGD